MKFVICILSMMCVGWLAPGLSAQDTTPSNGFAVVTVVSGNIAGLVATETLIHNDGVQTDHAAVGPSVLVTNGSFLVTVGPIDENTTFVVPPGSPVTVLFMV